MTSNHAHTPRVLTTEQFPQPKFCFPDTEMNSLYILDINLSSNVWFANIFSLT